MIMTTPYMARSGLMQVQIPEVAQRALSWDSSSGADKAAEGGPGRPTNEAQTRLGEGEEKQREAW